MNYFKLFLFFITGIFFISSCAKKTLSPKEAMKLEAQEAISKAESKIQELKNIGGETAEAEELLSSAKEHFSKEEYILAKEKAKEAYSLSDKLYQEILKARKEAEELAKREKERKPLDKYTVGTWQKSRDCLWNIAKRPDIYNDPWKWKKIYIANKKKIKNPDLIFPGQVFKIPR